MVTKLDTQKTIKNIQQIPILYIYHIPVYLEATKTTMGGTFRAVKPTKAIRGHKKSCLASSNPPSWVVATIRKGWSQSLGLCLDTGDTTDMFFGDKLRHIKSTWYPMIIHDISWSLNNCSPVRRLVIGWGVNECQCSCGQTVTSQVLSNEYISRSSIGVLPIYII